MLFRSTWEITGNHHTGTFFGTGEHSNRLTVSAYETVANLTIKVNVGELEKSVIIPVKDPDNYGDAIVSLTVEDDVGKLTLTSEIPQNKVIYKSGGAAGEDQFIIAVSNPNPLHTYTWYIDGKKQPSATNTTIRAIDWDVGYHTIRLTVKDDNGIFWSMPELPGFTVEAVKK